MKDGSYIWNITVEYRWNYEVENDEDENTEDFTIAAPNFETACTKVTKVFMKNHKDFKDTDENGKTSVYSIKEIELIKVERGDWIDG